MWIVHLVLFAQRSICFLSSNFVVLLHYALCCVLLERYAIERIRVQCTMAVPEEKPLRRQKIFLFARVTSSVQSASSSILFQLCEKSLSTWCVSFLFEIFRWLSKVGMLTNKKQVFYLTVFVHRCLNRSNSCFVPTVAALDKPVPSRRSSR